MAQVSYGTITITDTNDIERIYPVYCRGGESSAPALLPLTNWKENISEITVSGDYIWQRIVTKKSGINVTQNDYGDAVRLTGEEGDAALNISAVEIQYGSSANWSTTPSNWENNTPAYDSTKPYYWTRTRLKYENNTYSSWVTNKDYALTDAITKSVEANNNAAMANSIAQHANEDAQGAMSQAADAQYQTGLLAARVKNYWWDSNGAHIASGIVRSGQTEADDVDENNSNTYGYNSLVGLGSLTFGYNSYKAVELEGGTPSLKFYVPSKTTQTTNPSMVLTSSALTFNKIGTANKAVELTNNALNFYGSSTSTADAILSSTGLKLAKGGLEAGTKNTTDYIYIWSNDDATNHKLTINNHEASNWRIVAGNKFGVDKAGNLYASNAEISGKITATSLTIGSGATVSGLSTSNISGMNNYALQSSLDTEVAQRKAVYAVSTTGATIAAKTTESGTPSEFVLYNGATVTIKFNSANSTTTPTLNVNGTGAKTIKSYTGAALTAAEYTWPAGAAITFTYDGSYWRMQDGGALQAKADAAASASAASTQASAASTSATNASNAKTAAESAKTAAQTAQGAAESAKTAAQTAQSAAETASGQATTAKNDAVSAKTAAQAAQTAAETAKGQAQTAASNASQSETNAAASATAAAEVMGGFTILWNYSAFGGTSTAGDAFICGFDPATGTKSDANGWVKWNGTKRTITKQQVNPGTIVPYNIPIYIVCRLSSATGTTGTNYMVWYNAGWKYAACPSPTAVGGSWTWTDNRDIILGSFVETGANEVLTECELFNPPWTSKQITTNTTTPTSYIMDTNANKGIRIKPKDSSGNDFLQMNSDAIEFFKNSTSNSVMCLTNNSFRMGLEDSNHTTINSSGLHLWKGLESEPTNEIALFGSSIVLYQPGTSTAAVSITNSGATFTGGIVANSLTINDNGSSYNAWDAINITGYSLDIEVDATGVPTSNIYNNTYLYPHLYHNGTEITLPSSATTTQKQEFYNKFLWYEGDSSTAVQGDHLNKGRILASYGDYWKVTYSFNDGATEGAEPIQQVIVDPSTYITRINDNTIKVHSKNWDENTGFVQINNQGNIIATGQVYQENNMPLTTVQLVKW